MVVKLRISLQRDDLLFITFHSFARAKTFTGWLASNGQSLDKKCEIEAHVNEQSHVNEGIEAHVNEQSHVNEGIEAR